MTFAREYVPQYEDPSQLLFPPELLAKVKRIDTTGCLHERRVGGPRVPARYGSWATEICARCWDWRRAEVTDQWHPYEELVEALRREEEL